MEIKSEDIIKYTKKHLLKKYKKEMKSSKRLNMMFHSAFNIVETKLVDKAAILNIKLIINLMRDYYTGIYRDVESSTILTFGLTVFYLVYPMDMLSDFLPIFGFNDDISLVIATITLFNAELSKYAEFYKNEIHKKPEDMYDETGDNEIMINGKNELALSISPAQIDSIISNLDQMKLEPIIVDDIIEPNDALQIKVDEFFSYSHVDYGKLIYNSIVETQSDFVKITTEDIRKQMLDSKFFDFNICREVMMNNQVFHQLPTSAVPYKRILDSDKKQAGTKKIYYMEYEKNYSASNIIENKYEWLEEEIKPINNIYYHLDLSLTTNDIFNKEVISSIVDDILERDDYFTGIINYNFSNDDECLTFSYSNLEDSKITIIGNGNSYNKYIDVFNYLEQNFKRILKNQRQVQVDKNQIEELNILKNKKKKITTKLGFNRKNIEE